MNQLLGIIGILLGIRHALWWFDRGEDLIGIAVMGIVLALGVHTATTAFELLLERRSQRGRR
jgi:divalent metal cation (Fe/Co/Zn/Cd) transporter